MTLSLAFEILVSLLLVITIAYCFLLDRRLKALRSGQDGVRQSIQDLVQVSISAEQSVYHLTQASEKVAEELQANILEAKALTGKLSDTKIKRNSLPRQNRIPTSSQESLSSSTGGLMDRLKKAI